MRVRIRCAVPKAAEQMPAGESRYPLINGVLASLVDTEILLVDSAGNETPLDGVTRVTWSCGDDGMPAKATLEIVGVDIDVEGEAEIV